MGSGRGGKVIFALVCIILTSKIGQRSDETGLTVTLMILFTAGKVSNFI